VFSALPLSGSSFCEGYARGINDGCRRSVSGASIRSAMRNVPKGRKGRRLSGDVAPVEQQDPGKNMGKESVTSSRSKE
jgi:hypothetical protein